jgi:MFS family permease
MPEIRRPAYVRGLSTDIGSRSVGSLRHNRDYWWLWLGQTISTLGDEVFTITITLWVATVVAGGEAWAPLAVAGVMLADVLPVMFFSLVAGVYSDRWNRRRIMLFADAARFFLIAGLASVVFMEPLLSRGALLAITAAVGALVSTANQFFYPARLGMLGAVVPDADRERAASIATGTTALAGIVGPSVGAVLLVAVGAQWAILLNAFSFLVSFVAVARVRARPVSTRTAEVRPSLRKELMEGFRFIARSRTLKVLLYTTVAISAASSCLGPLEVFFVAQNLHGSPEVYGILGTVASVGALAGAGLTAVFAKRLRATAVYSYSLVASGLLLVGYSRMTTPLGGVIFMFVAGLPLAAMSSMVGPLLLRATPAHLLGRVSTALQPVTEVASLISMTVAAWLASTVLHDLDATVASVHFGPIDTIFAVAGILIALSGFGAARAFRQSPSVS